MKGNKQPRKPGGSQKVGAQRQRGVLRLRGWAAALLGLVWLFSCQVTLLWAADKPQVVIADYTVTEGDLTGGGEISLQFTVTNTHRGKAVENLLLQYTSPDNALMPAMGNSNQIYVGRLGPGASTTVELPLLVSDLARETAGLDFTTEYNDEELNFFTGAAAFHLPLSNEGWLEVVELNMAENVAMGERSIIKAELANPGKSDITNVVMQIDGGFENGKLTVRIGDIRAGGNLSTEQYISFNSAGEQRAAVSFTYVNDTGHSVEVEPREFLVNVTNLQGNRPSTNPGSSGVTVDTPAGVQASMLLIMVTIVFIIAIAIVLFIRLRQR